MIHLARDGTQLGQFPLEQVNQMLADGQLKGTELSWKEGLPGWVPLNTLEGITLPGTGIAAPAPAPLANSLPNNTGSVYAPPRSAVGSSLFSGGQVPPGTVQALLETRPWVLFIAILSAIGMGLVFLGGLAMLAFGQRLAPAAGMPASYMAGMAVAYLIMGFLYIFPIVKLFKYSGAINRLRHSKSTADLDDAMRQQKGFWKFVGIVMLIAMVIYLIAIIVGVGAGIAGARSGGRYLPPAGVPASPSTAP